MIGGLYYNDIGGSYQPWALPGNSAIPWAFYESDNGITLDTGKVVSLNDLTGNGNTMSQASAGLRPTYISNFYNGLSAFTPTNGTRLHRAAFSQGPLMQPLTMLTVGQWAPLSGDPDSSGGEYRIIAQGYNVANTGGSPLFQRFVSSAYSARMSSGTQAVIQANVSTWTGLRFVSINRLNGASSKTAIRLHGLSPVTMDISAIGTTSNTGFWIGSGSGASNTGAGSWGAPLAVCGFWSGTMSDTDRDYLLTYYMNRYGIVTA
jgi:hypothetical protein